MPCGLIKENTKQQVRPAARGDKGPPVRGVRWHSRISSPEGQRTMLYKLAIFASALLAGARAEVRRPCRTG